jgi:YD repeat-containing protein
MMEVGSNDQDNAAQEFSSSWLVTACFSGCFRQTNGPVQYVYDALGRLVGAIDANQNAAVYNYDAVGNILSITRYTPGQVSVISFTPGQGPVGASVTISGTGFSATASQNTVQFNGVAATVSSASANQLVATVPAGATSGPISVTTPAGSATSGSSFVVTVGSGPPAITGFTPAIAVAGGGVTINGTNFNATPANNRLRFNSVASAVATSSSTTTMATTVPAGTGSGQITLSTPFGTTVSPSDFFIPFNSHTATDVTYTGRTTIGGAAQNVTLAANKVAIMVFDATAGQHVSVLLNGSTFTNSMLWLFSPTGALLTNSASGAISSTLLPAAGTYSIGIETTSGGSAGVQVVSDITGTITIDGAPVTTTTTTAGQDVRLTFNATAGQQVVLTVTSVANPSATIFLLSTTGEALVLWPTSSSSLSINNNPAGQVFFMDQQTLLATGTYTIWIQHSTTSVGSVTMQLNSAADFVAPITPGGPAVRVPATGDTIIGQNGRLTFTGVAGHRVSMNLSNETYTPSNACVLTLEDPNLSSVTSGNCGSGASSFIDSATLTAAGTYTVFVDPQARATGHMTVQLNDATDVTGSITIDGPAVTMTTAVAGQDARVSFPGTAGQRIVVYATSVTNPTAYVNLVKPDGTTQASITVNNSSGQNFFMGTQPLATTGTYQLWVQHYPATTGVGSVTLQIASVPADVTATLTVPAAGATGPTSSLTIAKAGQAGTFTFSGAAGQQLSFNLPSSTLGSNSSGASCTIKNPDGSALAGFSCGSGSQAFFDTQLLRQSGTYTIAVAPSGAATGSLTMSINNAADVTGAITIDGSAVTMTTAVAGQDARLSFTATAGQRIVVYATNVTNPLAYVYLVRPDGTNQTYLSINNSPAGQTFFIGTQTLATTGSYQLWVRHYPGTTGVGSVTLQIASVPQDITGTLTVGGAAVTVPATGNTAVGQAATLTFSGTAGQQVTINVTNPTFGTSAAACVVTVKNSTNSTVAGGYCGTGAAATIGPFTTSAAGTYSITIAPQGTATGSVTISLVTP